MILLFLAALITASISALTGMAGGVVLLSLMTLILPIQVIIPVHGLVQLASNSLRIFYLRAHLHWPLIKYYIFGVPIGAAISIFLLRGVIQEQHIYIFLCILISYVLLKPKKLPSLKIKDHNWFFVGICTGVLAILVGSVGPFLAVFYVRDDLNKEQVVSSKAFMQMICHFIKIPSFLFIGFNYSEHMGLTLVMIIGAILGTKLGVQLLGKIDNKVFKVLFKLFLSIALIRIIFKVFAVN